MSVRDSRSGIGGGRIGRRLVLWFLASMVAVVATTGWALYRLTWDALESQMSERLLAVAHLASEGIDAASRLRPGYEGGLLHSRLRERLVRAREAVGAKRIFVFDRQGRSLVDSEPDTPIGQAYAGLGMDRSELEAVWRGASAHSVLFRGDGGAYYKTGYAPVVADSGVVAGVGVQIGARFVDTIRSFTRSVIVLGLAGAGLSLVVSLVLARGLTGSIRHLVVAARQIGIGDLSAKVVAPADDELGYLAETMDEMRSRILARDEQLRRMLGGVAHEIRNPLGGIELYAGLIVDDLAEGDPRKAHIQKVIGEVRNLNRVISEFLEFAKPSPASLQRVDLASVMREAEFLLAPELEAAGVVCDIQVREGLFGMFDPDHLKRALTNLMKNGLQAMSEGGKLTLRAREEGGKVVLEVSDTGPGLSPGTEATVFEPFHTTREQGAGLGLSIVRQAAEENGGGVEVDTAPGSGATFRIWMRSA
jgi:signal transduction histidine kinase